MAINESRRRSFGAKAELYDEARPRYARELFESVADYAGLSQSSRALEIGCGTGIATLPMAGYVGTIDAIDPSEEMIAVARRNLADHPGVRFRTGKFEDTPLGPAPYDLAYVAQAWHWIEPTTRCDLVADALHPGGALALFGHATVTLFEEGQEAYRQHVPEWFENFEPLPPIEQRLATFRETVADSDRFTDIETRRFPWVGSYTAEEFVRIMSTASDHAIVPEPRRTQMFNALAEVIEGLGGRVERANETLLVLARVGAPPG